MSISDYESSNRIVIEYLKKNSSWNLAKQVYYLTLTLGYSPARQKLILAAIGTKLPLNKVHELITDCIAGYYKRINRPMHRY